jgi:hypothetical protein
VIPRHARTAHCALRLARRALIGEVSSKYADILFVQKCGGANAKSMLLLLLNSGEFSYGGAQWGLYGPFKKMFDGMVNSSNDGGGAAAASAPSSSSSSLSSMVVKMAAGLSAGAVASAFITPVDVVMIRQFV